jgi:hypothetical protein
LINFHFSLDFLFLFLITFVPYLYNNNNNKSMKPNQTRSWTIPPVNRESRSDISHFDNSVRSSSQSVSMDDWNSIYSQQMDTSVSNNLYDVCQCCKKPDCDNLNYVNQLIRKLESDTRLAAGKYSPVSLVVG